MSSEYPKKAAKMLLTLPLWLPLMFLGTVVYTLNEICDDALTGIGNWVKK